MRKNSIFVLDPVVFYRFCSFTFKMNTDITAISYFSTDNSNYLKIPDSVYTIFLIRSALTGPSRWSHKLMNWLSDRGVASGDPAPAAISGPAGRGSCLAVIREAAAGEGVPLCAYREGLNQGMGQGKLVPAAS